MFDSLRWLEQFYFLWRWWSRILFREGDSSLTDKLVLHQDDPFLEALRIDRPLLYQFYHARVVPAAEDAKAVHEKLEESREMYRNHVEAYAEAMAIIQAIQPGLVGEIKGGIHALFSLLFYRLNPVRLWESFVYRYIIRKKQYPLLIVVSGGLGILNFISFVQLLGINIQRPGLGLILIAPLGIGFSASVMIAVKIGLSGYITATRSYRVSEEKEIFHALFPHGFRDSAVYLSVLIVVVDSLFSSIGLMFSLPPGVRDELIWQVAVIAVSAFASLVNVILAWGVTLEDIFYSLRFKEQAAEQKVEARNLEEEIKTARKSKALMRFFKHEISRLQWLYWRTASRSVRVYDQWKRGADQYWFERIVAEEKARLLLASQSVSTNGNGQEVPVYNDTAE